MYIKFTQSSLKKKKKLKFALAIILRYIAVWVGGLVGLRRRICGFRTKQINTKILSGWYFLILFIKRKNYT